MSFSNKLTSTRENQNQSFSDEKNLFSSKTKLSSNEHLNINNNNYQICFVFSSGSKLIYDYHKVRDCCFIIREDNIKGSNNKTIKINVPEYFSQEDVREYIDNCNSDLRYQLLNYSFDKIKKKLLVCEFFENNNLLKEIINLDINPNLNYNNSIKLLEFSFQKVMDSQNKDIFFKLFYEAINFISKNFIFFLEKYESTIININKTILEEILSKFLQKFYNDQLIETIDISTYERLIKLALKLRDMTNIVDLNVNENFRSISEENMVEIEVLKPTLEINLDKDFNSSFYKESEQVLVEKQSLVMNYFYNKNDDIFSVNFKSYFYHSSTSGFFAVTFFSTVVNLNVNDKNNKEIKLISISEKDKIFHNIFCLKNFSKIINNYSSFDLTVKLSIHIRVCFIQTLIFNYLLYNLKTVYNHPSISKLSKNDLETILKNKVFTHVNEDHIVILLINWLSDQINVNENIQEMIDLIEWKSVSMQIAIQFTVKFYKILEKFGLEGYFKSILSDCFATNLKKTNGENDCSNVKLQKEKEGLINYFLKTICGNQNIYKDMSSNLDYTNMLWENQKLIRYKSLSDFNENNNIDKNIAVLQSLNLNYSEIVKKSNKNGEAEISMEQGEIDRIQLKKDCDVFDEIIDSKGRIKVDISESFEVKDNFKEDEMGCWKIEIKDEKNINQPLPDSDNLNLELLDFSICEKDSETKDNNKNVEKESKEIIYSNISKKQVTKDIVKKPTPKIKSSNFVSSRTMNIPKNNKLASSSANTSKKLSIPKDGILCNQSQKSNNTNVTAKSTHFETPSLLYSYKLKKVNENYKKIKQFIKNSTSKSNSKKSRIIENTHSLSSMLQTNNNNKPGSNNDSTVIGKKNNLLDSITKSSCYDTFMITPTKLSSYGTFKRSSKTILKQDNKSSNLSMYSKEKNGLI